MDGGDRAFFRIDKEYRHAVCGLDAEEQTGTIRGGSVTFARASGRMMENANHVRMELFERNEFKVVSAEGSLKEAAIFEDVFAGVPFHEAEIEDLFGFEWAYAA